jgi:ribosomal protein L32
MPVPKKRLSKAKTRTRKTLWKQEALEKAQKALARALSLLTRRLPDQTGPSE